MSDWNPRTEDVDALVWVSTKLEPSCCLVLDETLVDPQIMYRRDEPYLKLRQTRLSKTDTPNIKEIVEQ